MLLSRAALAYPPRGPARGSACRSSAAASADKDDKEVRFPGPEEPELDPDTFGSCPAHDAGQFDGVGRPRDATRSTKRLPNGAVSPVTKAPPSEMFRISPALQSLLPSKRTCTRARYSTRSNARC